MVDLVAGVYDAAAPRITNNWKKDARPSPPHRPGSVASGFLSECLPFTVATVFTLAVESVDLISDWLAYHLLQQQAIATYSPMLEDQGLSAFYSTLPSLLFAFCIVATVVFSGEAVRFSYMFCRQRRMFMDKRDGVLYKKSWVEKYGGEVLTLLQCLLQDVPQSVIYLLLQVSISCDMLLYLQHPVLLLSYTATTLSVVYKLVQVVWSWGCIGQREAHVKGLPMAVLRSLTVVCALCALAASSLNLTLASRPSTYPHTMQNVIFDKLGIDRWMEQDQIVLQDSSRTDEGNQSYIRICSLKDIINSHSNTLTVMPPPSTPQPYWLQQKQRLSHMYNCSLVYQFQYHAPSHTVFYHYGYKCFNKHGTCESQIMEPTSDDPSMHLLLSSSANASNALLHISSHSELSLFTQSEQWLKCQLQLVWNSTMFSLNPCSFSPVDQ